MTIFENYPLESLNTFGIKANARFYAEALTESECHELLHSDVAQGYSLVVLGGGSNIVIAGDLDALVLHPCMRGIRLLEQQGDEVIIEAMAGENWHDFVRHCLQSGWFGLENLSLIPGTVGAAPIQNIGAYGVELTDVFHSLTAMTLQTGEFCEFSHQDCRFAYRDSVFKQEARDRYLITRVRFRLSLKPALHMNYGEIRQELSASGIAEPTPLQISDAIMTIRRRKLPDPAVLGNAGSFFKNPLIPVAQFERLKAGFPGVVAYPHGDEIKLAAGWLIDQAGWKGRSLGPVGAYEKQALVLVNHGGACGKDVLAMAQAIQTDVKARFGVDLEMEPRVYGV